MKRFFLCLSFFIAARTLCVAQWQNTALPSGVNVNTLIARDSMLLAGTNGEGIFISIDNGNHWRSMNNGLQNMIVHALFMVGTTIFAGTETGASILTDTTAGWRSINSGLSGKSVWSFAISNTTFVWDSTIYAGTWNGVSSSTDFGETWQSVESLTTPMPVHSLAVNKTNLYAATLGGGMFLRPGKGMPWSDISVVHFDTPVKGEILQIYSLFVFDNLVDTMVVAGVSLGFIFYSDPNSTALNSPHYSSQYNPILCFASRDGRLFSGTSDGAIAITKWEPNPDRSRTWTTGFLNSPYSAIYSMAMNTSYIFVATDSGVCRLWYPKTIFPPAKSFGVSSQYTLEQNYPNPFNPSTTISFSVPSNMFVSVKIFDLLGKEVATLASEAMAPGRYSRVWNASGCPSGMYFYRLQAGAYNETKRLLLVR